MNRLEKLPAAGEKPETPKEKVDRAFAKDPSGIVALNAKVAEKKELLEDAREQVRESNPDFKKAELYVADALRPFEGTQGEPKRERLYKILQTEFSPESKESQKYAKEIKDDPREKLAQKQVNEEFNRELDKIVKSGAEKAPTEAGSLRLAVYLHFKAGKIEEAEAKLSAESDKSQDAVAQTEQKAQQENVAAREAGEAAQRLASGERSSTDYTSAKNTYRQIEEHSRDIENALKRGEVAEIEEQMHEAYAEKEAPPEGGSAQDV